MTETLSAIPSWVLGAIFPFRTRDALAGRLRTERYLAIAGFVVAVVVGTIWTRTDRSQPPPFVFWLNCIILGAAFRGWRLLSARKWPDRSYAWTLLSASEITASYA